MKTRRQHYVHFLSPGTFVHEESSRPIETWDTVKATELSREVTERHGAKPFAFYFRTVLTADPLDDGEGGKLEVRPREVAKSGHHFLGGTLRTLDELENRPLEDERILRANMRGNGYPIVIVNTNSWKTTQPYEAVDCIVDPTSGTVIDRGNDPKHVAYREQAMARVKRENDEEMRQFRAQRAAASN